jgi:hypothetical protein
MAEDGVRPGDPARTSQRQIESSAHAVAVNRSNCGSGEAGDSVHQALAHLREAKCLASVQVGDFKEVGTGGEEAGIASDHETWRRALREPLDCHC